MCEQESPVERRVDYRREIRDGLGPVAAGFRHAIEIAETADSPFVGRRLMERALHRMTARVRAVFDAIDEAITVVPSPPAADPLLAEARDSAIVIQMTEGLLTGRVGVAVEHNDRWIVRFNTGETFGHVNPAMFKRICLVPQMQSLLGLLNRPF